MGNGCAHNYEQLPLSNSKRTLTPRREVLETDPGVRKVSKSLLPDEDEPESDRQKRRPTLKRMMSSTAVGAGTVGKWHACQLSSVIEDEDERDRSPLLQFAASSFYILDTESIATLELIRIGDLSAGSTVSFRTEDSSAFAGHDYIAASGTVVFPPREHVAEIQVNILNNEFWNPTTEFKVILTDENMVGAILVDNLCECQVRKVDTSVFPSDKLNHIPTADVSPQLVLTEFVKLIWAMPNVRMGTVFRLGVDLIHNLVYFLSLFMYVYLINHIIRTDQELWGIQDRETSLILYASITMTLLALLHVLDYLKLGTRVKGTAKAFLQGAIVKKYLNYAPHIRGEVSDGDIMKAIERDAPAFVESFGAIFDLLKISGELAAMFLFKVVSPSVFGTQFDVSATGPLLLFPIVLGTFMICREPAIRYALQKSMRTENAVANEIDLVTDNSELVLDFDRRSLAAEKFDDRLAKHSRKKGKFEEVLLNTEYFTKWVACVIIGGYIFIGGQAVIKESLTAGMFITNLNIFNACGRAFELMFNIIISIQSTFPSIMKIFELLNLESDNIQQMNIERTTRQISHLRKKAFLQSGGTSVPEDLMHIEIKLHDNYTFQGASNTNGRSVNFGGQLDIDQGQLVALVGSNGSGKSTLLRLIAGRLMPDTAGIDDIGVCIPAHLRRVTVCANPIFYHGTLLENITFGTVSYDTDRGRVIEICQKLSISEDTLACLDEEFDYDNPPFSKAECKLLNIARALFFNAEITCFHLPLALLDLDHQPMVMQVLREHVQQKGLGLNVDAAQRRRSRTIFLTSPNPISVLEADSIFQVSRESGISEVPPRMADEFLKSNILERLDVRTSLVDLCIDHASLKCGPGKTPRSIK